MKKLWKWLFGTRKQQCNIHDVSVAKRTVCDCSKQAGSLNLLTGEFTCWNCGKITKQTDR
ncbi:MAG TPA: hypothetical protein P5509_06345 [Bacteroidales bacterium]|nr:hypothetical protein [Bacteroidales bacterium]